MRKSNPATDAVVLAQKTYPKNLSAVVDYFGSIPYGKQKVDSRTYDRQITRMSPEDMVHLSATDPVGYAKAQQRLQALSDRADPPLPAQDTYEP